MFNTLQLIISRIGREHSITMIEQRVKPLLVAMAPPPFCLFLISKFNRENWKKKEKENKSIENVGSSSLPAEGEHRFARNRGIERASLGPKKQGPFVNDL